MADISLSSSQQDVATQIYTYGKDNGYSDADIYDAIKAGYIESSLGSNTHSDGSTHYGLYQYDSGTWSTNGHQGSYNNIQDSIKAYYDDTTYWHTRYDSLPDNIKSTVDFDDYRYIKHHDGRNVLDFGLHPDDPDNRGADIWNNHKDDKFKFPLPSPSQASESSLCIDPNVSLRFLNFSNSPQRSDPFTLDLNGNGIDTVGISTTNPILFDIDADGVKTSTGWIAATDGLLVLDRNGNGTIDNGRELFGDATLKSNGQLAADGFDAIADQDTNHDGIISSLDANWNNLRVWRDLNQDGISQASELTSLNTLGIASINVTGQEHSTLLNDGNVLADLGTFTYANGTNGTAGIAANLADVNLVQDTFTSQFTDHIPLTTQAATLPTLQGSGQVRNLQEAASLSPTLANLLTQFASASRADQHALLDQILKAWSDTSTMATTFTGAYAGHNLTVDMQAWYTGLATGSAAYQAMADKLTILEHFNGRTYQPIPSGTDDVNLTLWHVAQDLLNQSYDVLKKSVYQSLHQAAVYDTLVKPLLNEIQLNITDTGISLDFTALNADLNARLTVNPTSGIQDLLDFYAGTKDTLKDSGWNGQQMIMDFLTSHSITPEVNTALVDAGFSIKGYTGWNNGYGSSADDFMVGDDQADTISGGSGDDAIFGLGGNDALYGGDGNDTLDGGLGGTGESYLEGDAGNDTYVFRLGAGITTINNNDTTVGRVDTVKFTDVKSTELTSIVENGNTLQISFGSGDVINILNQLANPSYAINQFQFSDGVTWTPEQLFAAYPITLTSGNDVFNFNLNGSVHVLGGDGNDFINGKGYDDTLEGGAGNDSMGGGGGNDLLLGGNGDDNLYGEDGNDTLIGGAGNDTLDGGTGNDTYQFTQGDGIDTIVENDVTAGNTDVLKFTSGTSYDQLWFTHTGNNLEITIIGTTDKTIIKDWYTGIANHIEQITTVDGSHTLVDTQVQNLVNAMAGLTPPAAGQTTLPAAYQTQLAPVLAANWS
ncbi:MAG: calcium-binding protein [Methylophilaceae bacterium]|nr:calcium-binding protein [Methyloradius sp.]